MAFVMPREASMMSGIGVVDVIALNWYLKTIIRLRKIWTRRGMYGNLMFLAYLLEVKCRMNRGRRTSGV